MSRAALLASIQAFVGQKTNDCIDAIQIAALRNRCSVEVHDPDFNRKDVDRDPSRLDVFQDGDGKIKSFDIG